MARRHLWLVSLSVSLHGPTLCSIEIVDVIFSRSDQNNYETPPESLDNHRSRPL